MLADVDAGSDTPSLVGKVLQWRKESGDVGSSFASTAHSAAQSAQLTAALDRVQPT